MNLETLPPASATARLARLTWLDSAAFASAAPPTTVRALSRGGLLVDAIRGAYGVDPKVEVTREAEAGPNLERDIELRIGSDTLIEAHSLLPLETVAALPFLGTLGERAIGLALREHGYDTRSEYAFARATFPLLPNDGQAAAPTWARRFRIELPFDDVTIVEVFSPGLLDTLGRDAERATGSID